MHYVRKSDQRLLLFGPSLELHAGGEGFICAVPGDSKLVAKIYRRPSKERSLKLNAMLSNPPDDPMATQGHVSIAWPIDLLLSQQDWQPAVGFLMPHVENARPIMDFYKLRARKEYCPRFTWHYLHVTAINLATVVHLVHKQGYVIGDLNESNV